MRQRANAASRYTAGGCATATRFADVEPGLKAVDGSDLWRCPVRASRRVGMCTSRTPSAPGRSRSINPCGKAIEPAFRSWLRPCAEAIASGPVVEDVRKRRTHPSGRASGCPRRVKAEPTVRGKKPKRWSQRKKKTVARAVALDHKGSSGESSGDGNARRSERRVGGERLLRRLEAALNGLPARIVGAGATPGRRGRACESTLAAMPHQALGAGGRSRHGHSGPSGTGRPGRLAARRCNRAGCAFAAL